MHSPCSSGLHRNTVRRVDSAGFVIAIVSVLAVPVTAVADAKGDNRPAQSPTTTTPPPASNAAATPPTADADSVLADMRREAEALRTFARSPLAIQFLESAALLPAIETRIVYYNKSKKRALWKADYDALAAGERDGFREMPLDERYYYTSRYGTPLAYARAIDLLGHGDLDDVKGRKILDFGYGGIGQLRMLASLGAQAVGVEVDPIHPILYGQPGDQGEIAGKDGVKGNVRLVIGRYPADPAVQQSVGDGYDLIISKNTLKRGYIHPERPCDARMLIDLGVSDDVFVRTLYDALKPGGMVMIYNICPKPAAPDQPYIPWADGHSPFTSQQWEAAGFAVLHFDTDDTTQAKAMARCLGWDKQGMQIDGDLFAWYTLVKKPVLR